MMEVNVASAVTHVSVYPDRARVTCSGECEVETGLHRLLIGELPLVLEQESVRVTGEGTARVRILSVDVAQQHFVETPAQQVRDLQAQIEALEDEARVITDKQAGLAAQQTYLNGLRAQTAEFAKGLSRGKTTIEEQAQLLQFLQEQDETVQSAVRDLDNRKRDLDRELNKLRRELKLLQGARLPQRFQALVDVEVLEAGSFRPELSYVVWNAGWQPLYDVRLLEREDGRSLDITYIAQVTQNTGQDWHDVSLVVSTARPALNQRLPELKPWFLDVYRPAPPPQPPLARQAKAQAAAPQMATMAMGPAAEEIMVERMMVAEAEVAVAEVQSSGTAVSFAVSGKTDIPSDGSPHKTTINQFQLDPKLDYLAVPKHTDAVYRRATVANSSTSPMLEGPMNLFVGDEFIGKNRLEYTPANGEIELLLGVEENITVERTLEKRDVDKRLLRDNRQVRFGYKIEIKNLLPTEAKLEVHDHIPVARHEQIKVKLDKVKPEPAEQTDLHLSEWHLSLAAGETQTIEYEFVVEHPRSLQIVGLRD
jgi:uncharacterized protein (TIGR02231 family)